MKPQRIVRLKKKLIDVEKSQKQLSRETNIGENYISLIISGRYLPNNDQETKIAKALNCQTSEIFGSDQS